MNTSVRNLTLRVLEAISEKALDFSSIFLAIATSPYGASRSALERKTQALRNSGRGISSAPSDKQRYHDVLYRLRKQGLITRQSDSRGATYVLTARGKLLLPQLRKKRIQQLPELQYRKSTTDRWTIVVFDVPERDRRKRNWLRRGLLVLGFTMIQKSVWLGKVRIPQGFLDDIATLKLLDAVEIFEITKTGSLRHVV